MDAKSVNATQKSDKKVFLSNLDYKYELHIILDESDSSV